MIIYLVLVGFYKEEDPDKHARDYRWLSPERQEEPETGLNS